jgi:hypothetical protein
LKAALIRLDFLKHIKSRNGALFYFGLICLIASIVFLILTRASDIQLMGVNAWFKPLKFALSTVLFSWSMAWFCHYLTGYDQRFYSWSVIILLGFEIIYIAIQAGRGQFSHFNDSSPFYAMMFGLMGLAASLVTLYTAYIGFLFFKRSFPELPNYYVWSIRLGLVLFVVFSFEGFVMGSKLSHTIGAINDNSDRYIVGWSKRVGDLRVAHFVGMHALQALPFLAFYVLRNTKATIFLAVLYTALAFFVLFQALNGIPLGMHSAPHEMVTK